MADMKEEKTIKAKIAEIEEVLSRRRKPSPERVDIVAGLNDVVKLGKYGTLHKWEEKKKTLAKMDAEKKEGKPRQRGDEESETNEQVLPPCRETLMHQYSIPCSRRVCNEDENLHRARWGAM